MTPARTPEAPRNIPLAWSYRFGLAVVSAHCVPLCAIVYPGVAWWVRGLVIPVLVVSAWRARATARRLRHASLRPHAEGVELLDGETCVAGRVLPSSLDAGRLAILHWQADSGSEIRYFPVSRDAFDAESWRRLKVWLRWSVMCSSA